MVEKWEREERKRWASASRACRGVSGVQENPAGKSSTTTLGPGGGVGEAPAAEAAAGPPLKHHRERGEEVEGWG